MAHSAVAAREGGAERAEPQGQGVASGRRVTCDGTRLRVEVLGDGRITQPTIVFVHVHGPSQHVWRYQRRDLAPELRLVCYDQRGHASSEVGDDSREALGRDLAAVLSSTVPQGQRAIVVGHSLGGTSILSFARLYPERVERCLAGVVLLNTADSGMRAAPAIAGALLRGLWPGVDRDRRDGGFSVRLTHVAFAERLFAVAPISVKTALASFLAGLDLTGATAWLTVPTVVMCGSREGFTRGRWARRLAESLPDGTLVVLPGVGHMPILEAHETVTEQIRQLARRVSSCHR